MLRHGLDDVGARVHIANRIAISGWRRLVSYLNFYDRVVYTDLMARIFLAIHSQ